MKILYIDPIFGISGDMMLAALIDAGLDVEVLAGGYRRLRIGRVRIKTRHVNRCGIRALAIGFEGGRKIRFERFRSVIEESKVNGRVKSLANRILRLIRKTETMVHGQRHRLHELDDLDTLLDAFGFAFAVNHFQIDQVYCGPVGVGQGMVKTVHGQMPAFTFFASSILSGFDLFYHRFQGEIVTPTGAAIIASRAKPLPDDLSFRFDLQGLGAGRHDYDDHPNIVRIMIGGGDDLLSDQVMVIKTNIDDASPLIYEKIIEEVRKKGGLDIYLAPYYGRHNRLGVELTVIARVEDSSRVARVILKHTPTLGVRVIRKNRYLLKRKIEKIKTSFGEIRVKIAEVAGKKRYSIEYQDLKRIADSLKIPIGEAERKIDIEINRIHHGIV